MADKAAGTSHTCTGNDAQHHEGVKDYYLQGRAVR